MRKEEKTVRTTTLCLSLPVCLSLCLKIYSHAHSLMLSLPVVVFLLHEVQESWMDCSRQLESRTVSVPVNRVRAS